MPSPARTDSFGLILQWLFADQPAHPDELQRDQLLDRAKAAETAAVTGVTGDLRTLIEALKTENPGQRPTAREALAQLERIRDKPRRIAIRALALAVLVVIGLATLKYTVDLAP